MLSPSWIYDAHDRWIKGDELDVPRVSGRCWGAWVLGCVGLLVLGGWGSWSARGLVTRNKAGAGALDALVMSTRMR